MKNKLDFFSEHESGYFYNIFSFSKMEALSKISQIIFNIWENLFPNRFMKIKIGQFREIADILLQVHAC
jgi:hypothetical protein